MKRFAAILAGAGLALAAMPANAGIPTDIVKRHTSSGGNIDKIMADYADDAVVLQKGRAIQGKPAIRALFTKMFAPRKPTAGAAPSGKGGGMGGMKVTKVWEEGNVGFMNWEAGPMHTTEEFIINKDGKIAVQAIFMSRAPMAAPHAAAN